MRGRPSTIGHRASLALAFAFLATAATRGGAAGAGLGTGSPSLPAARVPTARPTAAPHVDERLNLRADQTPAPPSGLRFAEPADCDASPAVRAATGGSAAACRDRLNGGGTIAVWDPYADPDCTALAACLVRSFALYDFHTHAPVTSADGDPSAMIVTGASLGSCYVLRVRRATAESADSRARCVTVLRDTVHATYGPSQIGLFQAMVHDNHDHSYCSRDSWTPMWASESWGFVVRTRVLKLDPKAPPSDLRATVGWLAVDRPGTKPFPCPESLLHVWRTYLDFTIPPAELGAVSHATLAFALAGGNNAHCFANLWHAHHWYYKDTDAFAFSATIGANDGRMFDAVDPYGAFALSGNRATYDLTGDAGLVQRGTIEVALANDPDGLDTSDIPHAEVHDGRYLHDGGSDLCAAIDPHIDVVSVRTRTTAAPAIFQPSDSVGTLRRPGALQVATPAP